MLVCVYMPRYNIYIRETDKTLWDSIKNKSDFISKALNGTPKKNIEPLNRGPKKIILEQYKVSKICKKGHFYTGDKCMQKGCQ